MKYKSFEDYIQDKHARQYVGTDDNMPDDFDDWITDLSPDEWLEFGQKYADIKQLEGFDRASDLCKKIVRGEK